ncbi:hypothetical protein [Gordonia sihwensis]|uniref:hypothetical protein n=1 Tax=Gordonia sihwensis TaxID=173559 RepID=UPI0005ED9A47|nr:hypothetical protein [Gordonia sihwensis]KJR10267.1 hypothetical protein UG54_01425 [Gordonia sihwensis]
MTATDREPLYQQARKLYYDYNGESRDALCAAVDLALDAQPGPTDVEILRGAIRIMERSGTLGDSERRGIATLLEVELRGIEAAQDKAAAKAAQERLIEDALDIVADLPSNPSDRDIVTLLAAEGFLTTPNPEGGEA